ncbi:MAG: thiolase family protein [Micromonosporaceae bacterium]|nr:thiolase family protein [Micromonosporaceae bacterium]
MSGHSAAHGGATAIVGSATVVAREGDDRRRTALELHVEAARRAVADAGISRSQIGAVLTTRAPRSYDVRQFNMRVLNELKVAPSYTSEITAHGAGALSMLQIASMIVLSGTVDYVLCTSGNCDKLWIDTVKTNATIEADPQFEAPYGPSTPSLYAQVAQRYMHESGASVEQFARAAVESRRWAVHHPDAAMAHKGEITVDDVLSSRLIASPLHLLDCAPWYPGGNSSAMVVTRSERAESHRDDPVYLLGWGQSNTHEWLTDRLGLDGIAPAESGPNLTRTGAIAAARQAFAMAGLAPGDLDLAQTSAPFSFLVPLMLEQIGFCPEGEGGRFVGGGGVDFDGGFPFNTSGGYLSYGQSGQGLYLLQECIDQVRGRARGRPVPGARRALVHGHGGPLACHSILIVGSERG